MTDKTTAWMSPVVAAILAVVAAFIFGSIVHGLI